MIITSPFGDRVHPISGFIQFHNGVDLKGSTGTPIKAPDKGTVTSKYYNSAGGNQVVIKHANGYTTGYAHLNTVNVNVGQQVTKGEVIGTVGSTGAVTGAHLHFTVKDENGNYVNPMLYVAKGFPWYAWAILGGGLLLTGLGIYKMVKP